MAAKVARAAHHAAEAAHTAGVATAKTAAAAAAVAEERERRRLASVHRAAELYVEAKAVEATLEESFNQGNGIGAATITATLASACVAYGEGLSSAVVRQRTTFTIEACAPSEVPMRSLRCAA